MASPTQTPAPDPHPPNHTGSVYAVVAVFCMLSSTALVLRLMSRRLKKIELYYDDFLAIAAWIITISESAMLAACTQYGGLGYHLTDITPPQKIIRFLKSYYALAFVQTSALALAKLSVLVQLQRIFITVTFRRFVLFLGGVVSAWWISSIFAYAFICTPVRSNWTPGIPQRCGNLKVLNWIDIIPWIVTDFAILLAPIPMIYNLQLSKANKIGLCALFLTGGFTCIVACVRFSKVLELNDDVTWSGTQGAIWSVIETNVTVICACIVAIRPALRYLMPESLISSARYRWSLLFSSNRGRSSDRHSGLRQGTLEHSAHLPEEHPHRLATIKHSKFKAEPGLDENSDTASLEGNILGHRGTSQKEVV